MALDGDFSYERVSSAKAIERLSTRGGKVLEVVTDNDGTFVRRAYTQQGVSAIESCNRSFSEAWIAYNEMLQNAGVTAVNSELVVSADQLPIIASVYIEDVEAKQVHELPLSNRVRAAASLGKLLTSHQWFLPPAEAFQNDGFVAENGEVILIDIDPYLKQRNRGLGMQSELTVLTDAQGAFMLRGASVIDNWSTNELELRAISSAFVTEIGKVAAENSALALSDRFGIPHLMSNGFTYEDARMAFSHS